ncbi:MAG: Rpn family recombination-promoting nuclease/putative transposase, partial [Muribaculaceae bacterium]|nr:Rpn family recombination-promoting nuclease/putative transposase [Muribaculaceae bacterium]
HTYTTSGVFIDPSTDPGFKILFGREASADILIDLLNTILDAKEDPIKKITYLNKEHTKESPSERTMAFDIHCLTDNGKRFIVEMQNISQEWFIERCLMYGSRAITAQSKSGKWDYNYMPVISIAFTNFTIPVFEGQVIADGCVVDKYSGKPMTDRLRLIFIQLPQFNKLKPEECENAIDEWLFTIKNMKNMENIPFAAEKPIFQKVEDLAKMENLSPDDRFEYERQLKAYWDYYSTMKFARKEGLAEGRAKGLAEGLAEGRAKGLAEGLAEGEKKKALEIAKNLKQITQLSDKEIAEIAQLPLELVSQL